MDRRPTPVRPLVVGAALAAGLLGAAAMLSDRVPRLLGLARSRFDAPGWFPWAVDDTMFHFVIWLVITTLAALAVRGIAARLAVGAAAAVCGTAIEYLQVRWTATRSFETSDILANTRGVYLGLLIGLVLGAAVDALEDRRREQRSATP